MVHRMQGLGLTVALYLFEVSASMETHGLIKPDITHRPHSSSF